MMEPRLIFPDQEHMPSYVQAIMDERRNPRPSSTFHHQSLDSILERIESMHKGLNLPEGYVPSSEWWLVREGRFLGCINLRHRLNEALERYGGHIGYWVRQGEENKGYASYMVEEVLNVAASMGMERVLITCDDNNPASARVIEKAGGELQDKILNELESGDVMTRRYWIRIKR